MIFVDKKLNTMVWLKNCVAESDDKSDPKIFQI